MSKVKPVERDIAAIYRQNALDLILLGSMLTTKHILPSSSHVEQIDVFMEVFGLEEDDLPLATARSSHYTTLHNYLEARRNGEWKHKEQEINNDAERRALGYK